MLGWDRTAETAGPQTRLSAYSSLLAVTAGLAKVLALQCVLAGTHSASCSSCWAWIPVSTMTQRSSPETKCSKSAVVRRCVPVSKSVWQRRRRLGSTGSARCPSRCRHLHRLNAQKTTRSHRPEAHLQVCLRRRSLAGGNGATPGAAQQSTRCNRNTRPGWTLGALLGWNMLDLNFTTGALFGYSSENSIVSLNVPANMQPISIVFSSDQQILCLHRSSPPSQGVSSGPKMTAFQSMMLSAFGDAFTPCGGSCWRRLKSRMRRCAHHTAGLRV
jgi:hypothetical protein